MFWKTISAVFCLVVICDGGPVGQVQRIHKDDPSNPTLCIMTSKGCIDLADNALQTPTRSISGTKSRCIPTIYGCLDLSDPSIRPFETISFDETDKSHNTEIILEMLRTMLRRPGQGCIPTQWGCIDIGDPSFRP